MQGDKNQFYCSSLQQKDKEWDGCVLHVANPKIQIPVALLWKSDQAVIFYIVVSFLSKQLDFGLIAERPAPPRQVMTPQGDVSSRSLVLTWVPGSDGSSPIRYFTVQVRELPHGDWQTYSSSISHEATSCIVERYHMIPG